MTQTAEKPTVLTYDQLHGKFEEKFPQLLAPLERAKDKLDRGEGAQDLANIIHCEVERREEPTAYVYSWTGQAGQAFEYRVLKPFNPTPEPKAEASPEAHEELLALQESIKPLETTQVAAEAPVEAPEAPDLTPKAEKALKPAEAEPQPPSSSPGLFTALSHLIGSSTLLMTIAKIDDDLTVNVTPFGEDNDSSISPLCLTATPAELDARFAEAVSVKVQGRKSLAEQIEAVTAAEKELADANKAEAEAKKVEAEKKKKEAEAKKKQDEKKKQEEAQEAEKAKRQEALF